ncbi:MAG: FAD-dependent thymidylate synthase [Armatimonadota bacterium]
MITHTPDPEKLAASAARLCYSRCGIEEILESIPPDKIKSRIRDCFARGHHSIFEHVSFTFGIEGISRVATHQLVRHRIASYSQQSQRYVKFDKGASYIIPPSIKNNPEALKLFEALIKEKEEAYKKLLDLGVLAEDARFVFPQASETKIVVTMNARELLHFFNLRCCRHAQWEIRAVAYKMLALAKKAAPAIFEKAGPPCFVKMCPEGDEECYENMKKIKDKDPEALAQI